MKVYRNGVEIYDLQITDKTVINQRLQVENTLTVVYESQTALDITVLDYVLVGAEKYSLSEQPQYDQTGGLYKYSYLFQGRIHQLDSLLMPDEGADDFYYFGTLYDHLDFVLAALLEKESGWSIVKPLLASVSGVPKNINYSGLSVLGAFNRICNKDEGYGLEFNITGQVATFAKSIRRETAMEFSYGQGNGLYKLSRGRLSNSKITTRAYGYGGKTNMLDGKRLALDEKFLEKNIEHYGLREQKVIIDEIFPRRNGKITSNASIVQAGKANWVVYDTTMDFDLKGQIVEGAVIKFNTGDCAGIEFEIIDYDHATKKITFKEYSDETTSQTYILPNSVRYPRAGDEYVYLNIIMPASYEVAAKAELRQALSEKMNIIAVPQHPYTVDCHYRYLKALEFMPQVGDVVRIKDEQNRVNALIRISGISYPVLNPYAVKLTISEDIPVPSVVIQQQEVKRTQERVEIIDRRAEVSARKQSKALTELENYMLDTEGYFDVAKFKALSIEARMLAVGLQSQNFTLSGIRVTPNSGNLTTVVVTAGTLTHASLELSGLGSTWAIAGETLSAPDTSKAYYIYAKCSKNTLQGTIKISETELKVEQFPNYYVFNLGVLYPQRAGESWRDYSATYGVTSVVGDQIYGGGIKALDGFNFVDLRAVAENGRFRLGDRNSSIDFGVTEPKTLTMLNTKLVSRGGNSSWLPVYRGSWTNAELYYAGETVTYNGSMYQCKVDTSAGTPPTNVTYWDKMVSKGMDGQDVDPATVKRLEFEATQKAAAAQQAAESYATAQIAAEKTRANAYADGVADAAEQAAITAAEAKANAALITAKAYADGVVTAEEARAIADAQAKADAAKDAAIAAAASDATAKSNAAKVAAEAYALAKAGLAETTAKAYADGVVDAEEARSIADATNKANYAREAAINAAKEADKAIIIGSGKNYIPNSRFDTMDALYAADCLGSQTTRDIILTPIGWVLALKSLYTRFALGDAYDFALGDEIVISALIKSEVNTSLDFSVSHIDGGGASGWGEERASVTTEWKVVYVTFKIATNEPNNSPAVWIHPSQCHFYIAWIKLEKGNKPNGYTPFEEVKKISQRNYLQGCKFNTPEKVNLFDGAKEIVDDSVYGRVLKLSGKLSYLNYIRGNNWKRDGLAQSQIMTVSMTVRSNKFSKLRLVISMEDGSYQWLPFVENVGWFYCTPAWRVVHISFNIQTDVPDAGQVFILYPGYSGESEEFYIANITLTKGNKPSLYDDTLDIQNDTIAKSISDSAKNLGFTTIENGLIQSNLIQLRQPGGAETAGMSGVQTGPAFWSGGSLSQAIAALNDPLANDTTVIGHNGKGVLNNIVIRGAIASYFVRRTVPNYDTIFLRDQFNLCLDTIFSGNATVYLPNDVKYNGIRCLIYNNRKQGWGLIIVKQINNKYYVNTEKNALGIDIGKVGCFVAILTGDTVTWYCENHDEIYNTI